MIDQYSTARDLYTVYCAAVYCAAVGGVNFKGDPLPSWEDFYNDPEKQIQVRGWMEVAQRAIDTLLLD